MSALGERLLELCFPTRCCFCRRLTGPGRPVCALCAARYPDRPAGQRERLLAPGLRAYAPLRYEGRARDALLRYKFGERTGYAPVFAAFMLKCLDENAISCDSITWVPLSGRRLRERGYDQARLLAEALAAPAGLHCERMLVKTRHTRPQSGLRSREQRRKNAEGAYRAADGAPIRGRRVLLVDDIVTSGATLSACAGALKRAGAAEVICLTAASRDL